MCLVSKSSWSLLEEVKFYLWMTTSMCISLPDLWLEWELKSWLFLFVKSTQQICESKSIKISIPLSHFYPASSAYQRWWQNFIWLLGSLYIAATNSIYISLVPCMKGVLHVSLFLWSLWSFNLILCLFSPKNFLCFLKHDYWAKTSILSF